MIKKFEGLAKKCAHGQDAAGMRPRAGHTVTASQKLPGHDPIALPKRTEPDKTDVRLGSRGGVGLTIRISETRG